MADMDLDLDELDLPRKAPTRPGGRFAPKGSKIQLKPKLKPKIEKLNSNLPLELNSDSMENEAVVMELDAKAEEADTNPMELEDTEEEDEVVREIDVYFTPSIDSDTKLYVMQYPLRPVWRPYDMERCEEVRVKPNSGEVEVILSVDQESKNYDSDGDPETKMTKEIISTSWLPSTRPGYAIGVLIGDKLHMNPINVVAQLRPSLEHLKPGGSENSNIFINSDEDTVIAEEPKREKSIGTSKNQKIMATELSKQNKGTQEWVPLEYHDAGSINSLRYLQKMIQKETSPIQFSMSPRDYLDSLCSIKPTKNLKSDGLSKRSLLSLPLEERFKYYLVQGASIHRFDALTHLLNPDESIEEMLKVLQENAQLVQGLWVPKSSLLQFETNQEINELARDYILVQFNKSLLINNSQIPNSPLILVNAMKNVLNTLAIKRITLENWKFKEDQDTTFIKLYPNIVKKQEENFKLLEKHIHEYFTKKKITGFMSNTSTSSNSSSKTFKSVMSEETKEGLSKAIVKILHSNKVCSFQEIRKYMREIAIYASGHPKGNAKVIEVGNICDEESEEFQIILNEVAMNVHGLYVLRSSLDYPQYDDLRKIVIELLIGEGPNAKIKKASIYEAAKLKLKREISNIEYQKVLQEICVSKGSSWVLKNVDENSV